MFVNLFLTYCRPVCGLIGHELSASQDTDTPKVSSTMSELVYIPLKETHPPVTHWMSWQCQIDRKVSKCLLPIFAFFGLQAGDNPHTSFNSAFYAILFCIIMYFSRRVLYCTPGTNRYCNTVGSELFPETGLERWSGTSESQKGALFWVFYLWVPFLLDLTFVCIFQVTDVYFPSVYWSQRVPVGPINNLFLKVQ